MCSESNPNTEGKENRIISINLPSQYCCGVSFTFDTDMANGYSPVDSPGCHGRTARFVADTMRRLMDVAEEFGVRLHFFKIANGLEEGCDWSVYIEALERGHQVDSHTYNHLNLAYTEPEKLEVDLRRANDLLRDRLGIEPMILRGPGGYPAGALGAENRKVILECGFKYVSGEFNANVDCGRDIFCAVYDPIRHRVYRYPDGLVEIPIHGWTDRSFFDGVYADKPEELYEWRKVWGHKPVPDDWRCPWTKEDAIYKFIEFHKRTFDVAYENRCFYNFCGHPYSFYLHDRDNIFLRTMFEYILSRSGVWVGTLRDFVRELISSDKVE